MTPHCFGPARILLPAEEIPMKQWACVACDQYTSQKEYWDKVCEEVKDVPSTLHMILPEAYLNRPDEAQQIQGMQDTMKEYLRTVLTREVNGFIYLERTTETGVRQGIVGMVDLESYSFDPFKKLPVRPTEHTVLERIPPRLNIRRGAEVETPHIMMLADDPACTVVEPIGAVKEQLPRVYSGELMEGGGSIQGWAVEDPAMIEQIVQAVDALGDQARFDARYPEVAGQTPITLAVGDGNHSLATAKSWWEEVKKTLTPEQQEHHPARYCLAEVCNLFCPAIQVEPIHRVLFGGNGPSVLLCLTEFIDYHGGHIKAGAPAENCAQKITFVAPCRDVTIGFDNTWLPLTVDTVEAFLSEYLSDHPGVQVDYIHGRDVAMSMGRKSSVSLLLPPLDKEDLFRGVIYGGVLPRKTFSMGHAWEKRYYLECRKITE